MSTPNVPLWDSAARPALPMLEGEHHTDVCVVGLGGSGLSAVNELRALGKRVIGLDAGVIAGGAAGRNGGFLLAGLAAFHHDAVAEHGRERATALYRLTIQEIERIARDAPDAVHPVGSLRIAAGAEEVADCKAQLEAMRADDLPAEWYSGPEGDGLLVPTDGTFQPVLRAVSLARQALGANAALYERSAATSISGNEVHTAHGVVHCDRVIVAVDGRLELLLPELEGRVRTARLQMLATAPDDSVRLPRPVYMRWGYDYWQQLDDGSIALGGCRDLFVQEEWTPEAVPTARVQAELERVLRERVGATAPVTHRWAASVAYTADGLPVFDEVRPGVWAIGGYCGTGNVVGAICGRAVARVALGMESEAATLMRGRP